MAIPVLTVSGLVGPGPTTYVMISAANVVAVCLFFTTRAVISYCSMRQANLSYNWIRTAPRTTVIIDKVVPAMIDHLS